MKLPAGWYAFGAVREFKGNKPKSTRRFGLDLVVWKTSTGHWVCQKDACPHRSAKLSLGKIKGDCITCPFHGFQFDAQGSCQHVPEIGKAAPGLKVQTYPLIEKFGFLWICWGNPEQNQPEWFTELESPKFTYSQSKHEWKTHFSRCVENQLDYAHLPFVHGNSIGRGFDPKRKVRWELGGKNLKVILDSDDDKSGYFEFQFPNIWRLMISSKFVQTLMFVPVDENTTYIYQRSYHAFTQLPILKELIALISIQSNRFILAQDHQVVMSQVPIDVRNAAHEGLFGSDQAVQAFRKWLSATL